MGPFEDDRDLAAALRSMRPEPSPAFAAELDRRVAAGFPPRSARSSKSPPARLAAWLRAGSPRRFLIPASGVAMVAIVVATAVVAESDTNSSVVNGPAVEETSATSESAGAAAKPHHLTPSAESAPKTDLRGAGGANAGPGSTHSGNSSAVESSAEAAPSAGSEKESGGVIYETEAPSESNGSFEASGHAAGAAHRDVERASQIVLGAKPGEVSADAGKVFAAVHSYRGIVLDSSIDDGTAADAEANFELLIPSGRVGDAMAAFSRIGEVRSRHEATTDITAPTVGASERLQDSKARIDGLLAQLAEATTDSEREAVEAELRSERNHAAHLEATLANLDRRANLSHVALRIVSGKAPSHPAPRKTTAAGGSATRSATPATCSPSPPASPSSASRSSPRWPCSRCCSGSPAAPGPAAPASAP